MGVSSKRLMEFLLEEDETAPCRLFYLLPACILVCEKHWFHLFFKAV